jgi:hypothetical protein
MPDSISFFLSFLILPISYFRKPSFTRRALSQLPAGTARCSNEERRRNWKKKQNKRVVYWRPPKNLKVVSFIYFRSSKFQMDLLRLNVVHEKKVSTLVEYNNALTKMRQCWTCFFKFLFAVNFFFHLVHWIFLSWCCVAICSFVSLMLVNSKSQYLQSDLQLCRWLE